MRVVLVSSYFRPHVGGVERFVETLASGLAAVGDDVTVVCCRTDPTSPSRESGSYLVHRVRATNVVERRLRVPYPLPDVRDLRRLIASCARSADVVHVQDFLYATSQIALRAARGRAPVVVTQHVGFVRQRNLVLDAAEALAIRLARRSTTLAERVAVYNPAVGEWAERTWGLEGVATLPTGVPVPPGPGTRREFGLDEDGFVALFVGRDVPKKGLRHVLDAVSADYTIVAVTDAALRSRPGLAVKPFMSPESFGRLLRTADVLLLPSEGEGLPLVIQEAALAGIPIVTSPHPGYDAFFQHDDLVAVQPSGPEIRRALTRLMADPSERERLSARVRVVGEQHFGIDAFVAAYRGLYHEAMGSRP